MPAAKKKVTSAARKSKLKLEQVKTSALVPYDGNSRKHSDEQIAQIAASITEFGFLVPILADSDNGIIAGHGRWLAAQLLELGTCPVIRATHLTDVQQQAYIIADNKLTLNSDWDEWQLDAQLNQLSDAGFDIELTGFSQAELDKILAGETYGEPPDEFANDDGESNEHKCPSCGYEWR